MQKKEITAFTQLPLKSDPEGIQTPDFQNRNLTFYSAELPGPLFLSPAKIDKLFPFTHFFLLLPHFIPQ